MFFATDHVLASGAVAEPDNGVATLRRSVEDREAQGCYVGNRLRSNGRADAVSAQFSKQAFQDAVIVAAVERGVDRA